MRFSFKKSLMVRLLAIFFLISFLPALVIGVATSELARVQNRNDIFSELQGINESKKIQIIQYIENTVQKALSLANQSEIVSLSQKVHSLMEQYPVDSEEFNAKVLEIQESYEQVMHNYHTTAGFAEINIISKDMGVLVFSEHAEKAILNSQGSEEEQELYSIWNDVRSSGTPTR